MITKQNIYLHKGGRRSVFEALSINKDINPENQLNVFQVRDISFAETSHGSAVRLPKIHLFTFSGKDITKWPLLSLVHNNPKLSDIQKIYFN